MGAEQSAERPVRLSEGQLTARSDLLPSGATVIGGLVLSYEKTLEYEQKREVSGHSPGECVLVFYALDDHTIHRAEMCGGGTSYEIVSDSVVGSW